MRRFLGTVLPFLLVLLLGVGGTYFAVKLRRRPPRRPPSRQIPEVVVKELRPCDIPVLITGYGTIRARDIVRVAPEVGGRIVKVAPFLEAGRFVKQGAELLVIDPQPYELKLKSAKAEVDSLTWRIQELTVSLQADKERLSVLQENSALAEKEYRRLLRLLREENVGSESQVEAAQRVALQARDQLLALQKSLRVTERQLSEVKASLESGQARVELAELDVRRTRVTAPASGLLDQVEAEVGQVVGPGQVLCVIKCLDQLEVPVPLEGRDLLYLPVSRERGALKPVSARITWLQGGISWSGVVNRLERYDERTRSAVVVVSLTYDAAADGAVPPQVGMFCKVSFRGTVAKSVYLVPRDVIRSDGTVPVEENGVLRYRRVEVLRWQGEDALVCSGLRSGDRLILTPLPRAAEGMAVRGVVQ